MTTTRDQFIETANRLLEKQGYHATGLSQIIRESGAPKGSLYYHFPGGKEALAEEAIQLAGQQIVGRIRDEMAAIEDSAEAIQHFIMSIAHHVERSHFSAGGPLMTVALETAVSSERLNLACRSAYDEIKASFADKLTASGFPADQAAGLATFITAAIEGGIILSRAAHSGEPLRAVAGQIGWHINMAKQPFD